MDFPRVETNATGFSLPFDYSLACCKNMKIDPALDLLCRSSGYYCAGRNSFFSQSSSMRFS